MSRDVITVDGEEVVVREDTAKAYRGVHWAITSIVIMIAIMTALFVIFFWGSAQDGDIRSPADDATNSGRR